MRILAIHKAQGLGDQRIDSLEVSCDDTFPDCDTLATSRILASKEGKALAQALRETLPGATLDHLTAELLRLCASQLVIAHKETT